MISNDLIMIFFIHAKGPYSKKCILSQPQPWLSLGFILSLSVFPSNQRTTDGTALRFHILQLLHFQLSLPMTPLRELAAQCTYLIQLLSLLSPSPKLSCFSLPEKYCNYFVFSPELTLSSPCSHLLCFQL